MNEKCGTCYNCLDDPDKGLENPVLYMMILCVKCGNKRCPHSTDHKHECTGSNEPNQSGSRY
jgi:hypothetical protein